MKTRGKIEFGDFQTPPILAQQVCALLKQRGIIPDIVIEPTCGVGAFVVASAEAFSSAKLQGWDINADYVLKTRQALKEVGAEGRSTIAIRDFFKHDWKQNWPISKANFLSSAIFLG
jgi:tRNA/tmRNA/rRNA uracil-C5-methylase (TrmA/RlmC/RlmD family)